MSLYKAEAKKYKGEGNQLGQHIGSYNQEKEDKEIQVSQTTRQNLLFLKGPEKLIQ